MVGGGCARVRFRDPPRQGIIRIRSHRYRASLHTHQAVPGVIHHRLAGVGGGVAIAVIPRRGARGNTGCLVLGVEAARGCAAAGRLLGPVPQSVQAPRLTSRRTGHRVQHAAIVPRGRKRAPREPGQPPNKVIGGVVVSAGRAAGVVQFALCRGHQVVIVQNLARPVIAVLKPIGRACRGGVPPVLVDHPAEPVKASVNIAPIGQGVCLPGLLDVCQIHVRLGVVAFHDRVQAKRNRGSRQKCLSPSFSPFKDTILDLLFSFDAGLKAPKFFRRMNGL